MSKKEVIKLTIIVACIWVVILAMSYVILGDDPLNGAIDVVAIAALTVGLVGVAMIISVGFVLPMFGHRPEEIGFLLMMVALAVFVSGWSVFGGVMFLI